MHRLGERSKDERSKTSTIKLADKTACQQVNFFLITVFQYFSQSKDPPLQIYLERKPIWLYALVDFTYFEPEFG